MSAFQTEVRRLQLEELIQPLSPTHFVAQHWAQELPFVARANESLLTALGKVPFLKDIEALLARAGKVDVSLFGPDAFRSTVPSTVALDFLSRGYNLYVGRLHETIPESRTLFLDAAQQLGVAPSQVNIEVFAGTPGAVSSRHYDHDANFQILLHGKKEWRIEKNANIVHPLLAHHPTRDRKGRPAGFREEAYATDPTLPDRFSKKMEVSTVGAGTTIYLPRGYWHEVVSLTDTFSINFVIRGVTWGGALASALQGRLMAVPEFRRYLSGVAYGDATLTSEETTASADAWRSLIASAKQMLDELTLEEATLADSGDVFSWVDGAAERRLVEREGSWYLEVPGLVEDPIPVELAVVRAMQRLVAFRFTFTWHHAFAVARELTAIGLHNLLCTLVDNNLLNRTG